MYHTIMKMIKRIIEMRYVFENTYVFLYIIIIINTQRHGMRLC